MRPGLEIFEDPPRRLGLSTEEIQETFKKFDADGSGQVAVSAWARLLR